MFYSQCLVSKKGALRPVWIAAYCHKRLKKDQVSQTDIPSSVDEIIQNEVTITYRVLGYLLLGVVRIYSKKVEFLYKDCNEVLTNINTYVPPKRDIRLKRTMCAPYHSITLPEKFELDAFNLDIMEDVSRGNTDAHQLITCEGPEDGQFSLVKYHQEEVMARFETGSTALFYDQMSPSAMDIDMVARFSPTPTIVEASMERFRDGHVPEQEGQGFEMICWPEKSVDDLGTRGDEVRTLDRPIKLMEITPPDPGNSHAFPEDSSIVRTPNLGAQLENVYNQDRQIKFLEITPPEPENSHVFPEVHTVVSTGPRDKSKLPNHSGVATQEFMLLPTPATMEKPQFSRKRKYLFDDMIVLPNKVVKKSLAETSSLVVKRRRLPQTALDAWKVCKFSDIGRNFSEPSISSMSSQLIDLFHKNKFMAPEPVEDAEHLTQFAQNTSEMPCKPSEQEASIAKNIGDHSVPVRSFESPMTGKSDRVGCMSPVASGGDGMPAFEAPENRTNLMENPDNHLNLMDEEVCSQEEHDGTLDGLSVRTRKVAKYLSESFQNQKDWGEKDVLSLEQALDGRTRKESARLFYEILVLKSRDFVDVKQEAPYADVFVMNTSKLTQIVSTNGANSMEALHMQVR